jgi:hypothetical protein
MKAKDLMIGNWVNYEGNDCRFTIYDMANMDDEYVMIATQPIPLTEEWLVKFGGSCTIMEGYPIYFLHFIDVEFYELESIVHFGGGGQVKIKHVHQLQNLFKALTGKDLEIKTK